MGALGLIISCVVGTCHLRSTSDVTSHSSPPPLSSLRLSPQRLTLDIGEVYQFRVSARLSDGSGSPRPAVRYSSSQGQITASGLFTAPRTGGVVQVMARAGAWVDTAVVRVVARTEPLFSDDFESCVLNKTPHSMGFQWRESQGHPGEVPVVTNSFAHSGSCSLKFTFQGGPPGADSWSEQRFSLGKKLTEVYLQWFQYFPTGTETPNVGPRFVHRNDTGPDNNKFLRLWDEDYTNYRLKLGFSTLPSTRGDSRIISEYGTNKRGVGPYGTNVDPYGITDARRGRWIKIQVHVRVASIRNNDGVIEMWIDGAKTISNTNLPMYPSGGEGNYLRNGYLMGWANSGFDINSVTYIDDLIISIAPLFDE